MEFKSHPLLCTLLVLKGEVMKSEQLLGKRIRELRRTHKMTIEQLAERAGINDKYLGSIERGEQNPSFKVVTEVARSLEVELSDLFRFEHTEDNEKVLRQKIADLLKRSDLRQLQILFKIIKNVIE